MTTTRTFPPEAPANGDVLDHPVQTRAVLSAALTWLFHTVQPASALASHQGCTYAVGDRTYRFSPSGTAARQPTLTVEVRHPRWDYTTIPPRMRNPLDWTEELPALSALLAEIGHPITTWSTAPPAVGAPHTVVLILAGAAHPTLRNAVRRYEAGCPRHGHTCGTLPSGPACTWMKGIADLIAPTWPTDAAHLLTLSPGTACTCPIATGIHRAGCLRPQVECRAVTDACRRLRPCDQCTGPTLSPTGPGTRHGIRHWWAGGHRNAWVVPTDQCAATGITDLGAVIEPWRLDRAGQYPIRLAWRPSHDSLTLCPLSAGCDHAAKNPAGRMPSGETLPLLARVTDISATTPPPAA